MTRNNPRITEMDAWDADYFAMKVPTCLSIRKELTGKFQFVPVQAQLDGKIKSEDASSRFSFSGRALMKTIQSMNLAASG